ncbi:MAG: VWA domain-containing protein [Elusimicrobiota bacterium]|jgi:Ca-activated chloride channel family protein|nr:VWA domain-containing protein [Elusimicrobiota bacterium]
MRLSNPIFLIAGLLILCAAFWYLHFYKKYTYSPTLKFSRLWLIGEAKNTWKATALKTLKWLRLAAFLLLLIALSRPQVGKVFEVSNDRGVDIIIAIDTSSSMRSIDFLPNRLEAAKKVCEDFIRERKYDRIGLVNFAGLAFTQSPLTTDKQSLADFVKGISIGDTGLDGTAIGSAIIASVNRLKNSTAKSKVIILLTDGNNNMGEVDPMTASQIAAEYDIKIYAVGVGSAEGGIYIVDDPFFGRREVRNPQDRINEDALKQIASNTGGQYFRALDMRSFENIMKQIDSLEKDDIKVSQFTNYNEVYKPFALIAFILLLAIVLLENTILRKLP